MSVKSAIKFLRSYGVKCNEQLVEEWFKSNSTKNSSHEDFCEDDLYDFNEWCRWQGTAYEEGIDDKTKIKRLIEEEINELKSEVATLTREKKNYKIGLECLHFK